MFIVQLSLHAAISKQELFHTQTTAGVARQPYLQFQRNRLTTACFTVIVSSPIEIFEHENENLTECCYSEIENSVYYRRLTNT